MRRLKTVRRPPYPNGAQVISPPVAPSLPLRCPHAVQRCPSVDSGLEKAAELSGISNYGLVDVNLEVLRQTVKDLEGILPSPGGGNHSADAMALLGREYRGNDPALQYEGIEPNSSLERLEALRGLILYGRLGTKQEDPLPEFPLELNHPNIYYLYVGNAR